MALLVVCPLCGGPLILADPFVQFQHDYPSREPVQDCKACHMLFQAYKEDPSATC